jgi:SPP1 gp7 family putative phage head morphogenesis protein
LDLSSPVPNIPNLKDIQNNELKYAYEHQGEIIFPEMYAAYNNLFYSAMVEGLSIDVAFKELTNTAFFEQYLVNSFQFSAAKNLEEMKELQKLVFDENGQRRSFPAFQKLASGILEQYNKTWLRTEYDLAVRGAVLAEQWQQIWKDRDLFPYVIYRTRGDSRVRPEHAVLNGISFLIDSPQASQLFVPNGWNCRCEWEMESQKPDKFKTPEQLQKNYLDAKVKIGNRLVDIVAPEFRRNVGTDGIMPSPKYVYNSILNNANDAKQTMFKADQMVIQKVNKRNYSLYYIQMAADNWLKLRIDPNEKDIIFRNFDYKLNIRLSANIFDKIKENGRGFENIKQTVEHPSEIWGRWINPNTEKDVHINWILTDKKDFYLVESEKGFIINARLLPLNQLKKYRQGIKFLK